ncbi:MAG: hypothetical protein HWE10_08165 [Gammaproteobacteria bacterium]|nr:hypothetical protein [Gammaproteobacteria bacterium]
MNEHKLLTLLKVIMITGLLLIATGHYLLSYSSVPATYGVNGLILSGALMAFGIVLSLPTKMYLTFIFVKNENERRDKEKSRRASKSK